WLLSCSILTMASPDETGESTVLDELHGLHDRLPIPLDRETMSEWLNPGDREAAPLVEQVRSEAYEVAGGWSLREVGSAVGNVRNNGPELIEPVQDLFAE
ncbi:SOS response-associated peptidase family protein, partial [Arthrobacter rhombi]|uniref:SOS response-associated peptidase family protein n=2 Tax=Micrococcaceae TaxID=1268 RepID=UPI003F900A47